MAVSTPVYSRPWLLIAGLMMKLDPDKPAATVLWPETKAVSKRMFSNTSTALIQNELVFFRPHFRGTRLPGGQQFSFCGARLCAKHQPQRVGKQKRLVLCGRAAVGRDDTAALRAKMRELLAFTSGCLWRPGYRL